MNYFRFFSVLLSIFVISVNAAHWIAPPNDSFLQGRTGQCYESEYNLNYMEHGEVKLASGHCILVTCLEDGSVSYLGCPAAIGCEADEQNLSKPYPLCCPRCTIS